MANHRVADWAFFVYFAMQVPATIIFDSQAVYPEWLYPGFAKSLRSSYLTTYRDPFLANAWHHPWYLSICLVEHVLQMPFFFWATYIYYHYGAKNYPKIIVPCLIYAVHTVTAIASVWAMALGADFSQSTALAPRDLGERIHLCGAYAFFFFSSVWMIVDNVLLIQTGKSKNE